MRPISYNLVFELTFSRYHVKRKVDAPQDSKKLDAMSLVLNPSTLEADSGLGSRRIVHLRSV